MQHKIIFSVFYSFTNSPFSAVMDVGFTVQASEARPTGAGVGVNIVRACSSILAGRTLAFVDL